MPSHSCRTEPQYLLSKQRKQCDVSTMPAVNIYPVPGPSEIIRPLLVIAADLDDHDVVDEWGRQSFPASDPPQNW